MIRLGEVDGCPFPQARAAFFCSISLLPSFACSRDIKSCATYLILPGGVIRPTLYSVLVFHFSRVIDCILVHYVKAKPYCHTNATEGGTELELPRDTKWGGEGERQGKSKQVRCKIGDLRLPVLGDLHMP